MPRYTVHDLGRPLSDAEAAANWRAYVAARREAWKNRGALLRIDVGGYSVQAVIHEREITASKRPPHKLLAMYAERAAYEVFTAAGYDCRRGPS